MLIPVGEGLALYEGANEPKQLYIVKGAGHNDVSLLTGRDYGATIRTWLDSVEVR